MSAQASPVPLRRSKDLSSNQLGSQLDQLAATTQSIATGQTEAASDTYMAMYLQKLSLNTYHSIYRGVIQMALPHINSYRVALTGMTAEWICHTASSDSNYSLMGPRDTSMLQPLTPVLVQLGANDTEGIILCALPETNMDGSQSHSDCWGQGSNVGLRRDGYYEQYVTTTPDEGGALDYTHHRPLDQTSLDWGRMTETGLGFHLDPMMIMMRVNEMCGVYGFYQGNMLRVAGESMEVWSGAHTAEYREDESECTTYVGEIMYPWEGKGAFDQQAEVSREIPDLDVLYNKPLSKLEPKEVDQQAFHRYEEHGGYLGQGHIRQVSALPEDDKLFQHLDDTIIPGVFREHIGIDGSYGLASATEISFAKRSVIPIPKRRRLQNDLSKDSDSQDNYRASGTYGAGLKHEVCEIEAPEKDPQLTKLAALLDIHAHKFNWKTLSAFAYHLKDFSLPEEYELAETVGKNQMEPEYGELAEKTWLPLPKPKKVKIDERYKEISLYELMSMITMTNDGAIKITAGQGESITLGGGNILIDCPGSVILRPGKGFVAMAGDDAVIRARNSVDITAGKKDVRIKAEVNMQLLAGNSGKGGMLLESRAETKTHDYPAEGGEKIRGSGIVLKAAKSHIATLSGELYLRTGGDKELSSGPIVIDAGKNADINMLARAQRRFAEVQYIDCFGIETVRGANSYGEYGTLVNGFLFANSGLYTNGGIACQQGVTSTSGHFSSSQGGPVGTLPSAAEVQSQLDAEASTLNLTKDSGQRTYDGIDKLFYGDDRIGNEEVIKKVSVGLRNEEQYGTKTEFVMPQCYWQQLAGDSDGVVAWEEPVVNYQPAGESGASNQGSENEAGGESGSKTMPWPGYEAWNNEETLLTMPADSLKMFDLSEGVSKPRDVSGEESAYKTGKLAEPKRVVPQKEYKVINTKE